MENNKKSNCQSKAYIIYFSYKPDTAFDWEKSLKYFPDINIKYSNNITSRKSSQYFN